MTVELRHVRKVCVIGWSLDEVRGSSASIQAGGEEKITTRNDGSANIYFPTDFAGEVDLVVEGSRSGSDRGTISVA